MNTSPTTLWLGIGWTMLHFLWVGGVVAAGAAVVLRQLRGASAELRYAVALASLVLLALVPPAIAWRLARASSWDWSGQPTHGLDQAEPAAGSPAPEAGRVVVIGEIQRQTDRPSPLRDAVPPVGVDRPAVSRRSWLAARLDALAARLPWLWLVGSPLTFAWLALGFKGAERLRRRSLPLQQESDLSRLCRRLAVAFGVGRDVAVAVCDRVATPVLVGIVRPLILLPAAAIKGWGPEQIEMILLHELAHVRRWDNLVNLVQRLVESLLFFHPAVWIVSGWMRQEREHCCDRIVVAHTGRAYAYAETLLALASEPAPLAAISLALVPRRKHLVRRIRRILTPRENHPMKLSRSLILIVAAAILAPAFWIATLARSQPFRQVQTSQNVSPAGAAAPRQAGPVKLQDQKADNPRCMIQGKPLSDWLTALKDRDPTVRTRALGVLGDVTEDQAGDQYFNLQSEVNSVESMDKDAGVRKAAAAASSLLTNFNSRLVEIKPGERERDLGVIDVAPSDAASQGFFPRHRQAQQKKKEAEASAKKKDALSHAQRLELKGDSNAARDLAFSPDGKVLATAHWYSADPGEVKLWDTSTGALRATLPVSVKDGGVIALAFSPDGKTLAGSVGPLPSPRPPGVVVLWNVASRRELRSLRGHTARIAGLAFSPDGRTLASGGEDKTVRFWDVASGREIGRIEGNPNWVRSVAYSPDGKALAIGGWPIVKLWDVPGNRLRTVLEPEAEQFWVEAVAYSPDGRTLAAAGGKLDQPNARHQGQVRLYDMTQDPPRRRAVLPFHFRGEFEDEKRGPRATHVAFTPDGRRLAAVGEMSWTLIWDTATGTEQDSFERASSHSINERVAFSPDGHWLAIVGSTGPVTVMDIRPPAP